MFVPLIVVKLFKLLVLVTAIQFVCGMLKLGDV